MRERELFLFEIEILSVNSLIASHIAKKFISIKIFTIKKELYTCICVLCVCVYRQEFSEIMKAISLLT
jgi:hypothetical protein